MHSDWLIMDSLQSFIDDPNTDPQTRVELQEELDMYKKAHQE